MFKIKHLLIIFILFSSCAYKFEIKKNINQPPQSNFYFLVKLNYPQNKTLINKKFQKFLTNYYNYQFIKPFIKTHPSFNKNFVSWGLKKLKKRKYFFSNNELTDKKFLEKMIKKTDISNYPNANLYAITVRNCYLRVLPIDFPLFSRKNNFPFDVMQNSAIYLGTPVYITQFSKKKDWAFVESYIAAGWIKTSNLAFIDKKFIKKWYTGKYITPIKDKVPVYDNRGKFIFYAYIGSQFPLIKENNFFYWINLPVKKINSKANIVKVKVSKKFFSSKPLKLTYKNLCLIAEQLNNKPYYWGGLYFYRDCSMTIRDFFAPFDIYLPRNSYDQAHFQGYGGKFYDISHLSLKEKESFLIKNGIPYLTLVWMNGHIMLYIGKYHIHPIVFHNFWSLRKNGKKIIVGKSMLTYLNLFLKRVKGIKFVIPKSELKIF